MMSAATLVAALTMPVAPATPRIVHLDITNHSRLSGADFEGMRQVAHGIWSPYAVDVEFGAGAGAVTVVVADGGVLGPPSASAPVLGITRFAGGHALPFIGLSLGAAEAMAADANVGVIPFRSLSLANRDAMLRRMLGVALAHELAHYLLDTTQHSRTGLLQERFSARDLMFPNPSRLALTPEQWRAFCHCEEAAPRQ